MSVTITFDPSEIQMTETKIEVPFTVDTPLVVLGSNTKFDITLDKRYSTWVHYTVNSKIKGTEETYILSVIVPPGSGTIKLKATGDVYQTDIEEKVGLTSNVLTIHYDIPKHPSKTELETYILFNNMRMEMIEKSIELLQKVSHQHIN